jgi:hypothetical protein
MKLAAAQGGSQILANPNFPSEGIVGLEGHSGTFGRFLLSAEPALAALHFQSPSPTPLTVVPKHLFGLILQAAAVVNLAKKIGKI